MTSRPYRKNLGQFCRVAALLAASVSGAGRGFAQTSSADATGSQVAFVTAGTDGKLFGKPPLYIAKIDDVPTGSEQADWLGRVPSQDYTLPTGVHRFTLGFDLYGIINKPLPIQRTVSVTLLPNTHYRFDSSWPWRNILFESLNSKGEIIASTELSRNEAFYGQPGSPNQTSDEAALSAPPQPAIAASRSAMTYDKWLSQQARSSPDQ